jgi:hypothetical protein
MGISIYGSYLADAEKKIHHFPKDEKMVDFVIFIP